MQAKFLRKNAVAAAVSLALLGGAGMALAEVNVQCPGDTDGNAVPETAATGPNGGPVKCMHLVAGDGFAEMSDGHPMYTFGFANKTGVAPEDVIAEGILAARWSGSKIELDEGDEFYLSLTNVGTVMRPDLFDPHTVHFHGFPNAATVFDGVPEVSIAINMGSTLTYYYNVVEPGTYLYHCHVEATEHMEMGMLANLYVHPLQDALGCFDTDALGNNPVPNGKCLPGTRKVPDSGGPRGYAYDDNDGTTAFDVEAPVQVSGFDSHFHDAHIQVQPLPFAALRTNYPQINGRVYPDLVQDDYISTFPSQPYRSLAFSHPLDRVLVRNVNGGHDSHPFHYHGENQRFVGRDGGMLFSDGLVADIGRSDNTINSAPMQSVDGIWTWTGKKLGWDIFGTTNGHTCTDRGDGFDDTSHEYCPDHGKPLPVNLPGVAELALGGYWSGSPYMGDVGDLPPGEGGLNPNGGYFFVWHFHAEKELTTFNIFPGGSLSAMVVLPTYVAIQ